MMNDDPVERIARAIMNAMGTASSDTFWYPDQARNLARAAIAEYESALIEQCARIAENGCLVPPDGGSPTVEEKEICDSIATEIRLLKGAANGR